MTAHDAKRIIRVLTAPRSPLRTEGAELAVDYLLAQRLKDVVDLGALHDLVLDVLTEDTLEHLVERHLRPAYERHAQAMAEALVEVGDLVPDAARARIRQAVASSPIPRGSWARGAVDPALMRQLFAPVLTQLLLSFARRLPIPGLAGDTAGGREVGGMAERFVKQMQKRAGRMVDASRTAIGGLGAEVERRLQTAARDFSQNAMGMCRDALRERLRSEEGRALVAQIAGQLADHVMATRLADLHRDVERMPIDEWFALLPAVLSHAAPHAHVRGAVERELDAFLSLEGERPLAELLETLGVLTQARDLAVRQADALSRGFMASEGFGRWLERVLDADAGDTVP